MDFGSSNSNKVAGWTGSVKCSHALLCCYSPIASVRHISIRLTEPACVHSIDFGSSI